MQGSVVGRKHVAQRMERLQKAHRGMAGPAEAALRGSLKIKSKVAKVMGRMRPSVSSPIRVGTVSVSPRSLAAVRR